MSQRPLIFTLLLLSGTCLSAAESQDGAMRRPNLVIVVADDLGRSDVGFNGGAIATPHLDRLAATGIRLDRFYACPVCSPTRAGLMTGRWPIRYGLMRTVIPPWSAYGLPTTERTLPELLARAAGYERRGLIGKWHLGHAKREFLPTSRGFTSFYGHYNGAIDYFTHEREGETDWHRNDESVHEAGYATDLLAAEAVRFIESSPETRPYFLYVAFNAPHGPFQAKDEDLSRYASLKGNRRTYAAMVDSLDQGFGRLLEAIERRGDADNTLILFFSDNGGPLRPARNAPYRDGKFSVYEGGIRVAAAVRWPAGGLAGGRACEEAIGYIDVLPTMLHLAGIESAADDPVPDGRNVLDVLRGERPAPKRPWFSYIAPGEDEQAAVTDGDWKLVVRGRDVLKAPDRSESVMELYDLSNDPGERKDVAASYPHRVAELRQKLAEFGRLQPAEGVAPYGAGRKGFQAPPNWIIQ